VNNFKIQCELSAHWQVFLSFWAFKVTADCSLSSPIHTHNHYNSCSSCCLYLVSHFSLPRLIKKIIYLFFPPIWKKWKRCIHRVLCSKLAASFQSMEVRNSTFAAFIDVFTSNTYVMVVMSDPSIRKFHPFSPFPFMLSSILVLYSFVIYQFPPTNSIGSNPHQHPKCTETFWEAWTHGESQTRSNDALSWGMDKICIWEEQLRSRLQIE